MFELPTSIKINNKEYPIRKGGDFRMVLDCFEALNDTDLSDEYRVIASLIIFYDGMKNESDIFKYFTKETATIAVTEMYKFFNCGQESVGSKVNYKLVDWKQDAQLISGAVNAVAKKELRAEPYLHWWTFMGYYLNIGDSAFSTVVSIRHKIKAGKKLEKHEKEFKKDNPHYFVWDSTSSKDREAEELIKNLWNGG